MITVVAPLQFTNMLDLLEDFSNLRRHTYLRIDGTTSGIRRKWVVNKFNNDASIFLCLVSTR